MCNQGVISLVGSFLFLLQIAFIPEMNCFKRLSHSLFSRILPCHQFCLWTQYNTKMVFGSDEVLFPLQQRYVLRWGFNKIDDWKVFWNSLSQAWLKDGTYITCSKNASCCCLSFFHWSQLIDLHMLVIWQHWKQYFAKLPMYDWGFVCAF